VQGARVRRRHQADDDDGEVIGYLRLGLLGGRVGAGQQVGATDKEEVSADPEQDQPRRLAKVPSTKKPVRRGRTQPNRRLNQRYQPNADIYA